MRVLLYGLICLSIQTIFAADEKREPTLESVVKDYYSLQKSIDQLTKIPKTDCYPDGQTQRAPLCSVKTICESSAVNFNGPVLYTNAQGESMTNALYFSDQENLRSCLKEKFADEIKEKRQAFVDKVANPHLKRIIDANKKLNRLADIYGQNAALQKINSEILTMIMEMGIKNEVDPWGKKNVTGNELFAFITKAEKRTKIKLHPEIKSTLTEMAFLRNNQLYLSEIEKFDREVVPQMQKRSPLEDWSLLTDVGAAGGEGAMMKNREMLTLKTKNAYELFKEAKADLIRYMESKKNAVNSAKLDRVIQRINLLKFETPRLTKKVESLCGSPNAFYSSEVHSITLCPELLSMPQITIYETLAHEVAHSFDSCNYSSKLYKMKGPEVVEEAPFEIEIKTDSVAGRYTNTFYDDPIELGVQRRIQEKDKYADNPFSDVLSCLQNSDSVGAKGLKREEIFSSLDKKMDEAKTRGETLSTSYNLRYMQALKDNGKDYFDYFQGCDLNVPGEKGKSQLQEAFADKMATEVVAQKFKNASSSESERFMLELALSYDVCNKREEGLNKLNEFAGKLGCSDFFDAKSTEQKLLKGLAIIDPALNAHSDKNVRVERMILAHPEIRKALKCKKEEGLKYCE